MLVVLCLSCHCFCFVFFLFSLFHVRALFFPFALCIYIHYSWLNHSYLFLPPSSPLSFFPSSFLFSLRRFLLLLVHMSSKLFFSYSFSFPFLTFIVCIPSSFLSFLFPSVISYCPLLICAHFSSFPHLLHSLSSIVFIPSFFLSFSPPLFPIFHLSFVFFLLSIFSSLFSSYLQFSYSLPSIPHVPSSFPCFLFILSHFLPSLIPFFPSYPRSTQSLPPCLRSS